VTNNILEGITRDTLIQLFKERHSLTTEERDIDRTELYVVDELFYCGSAMEVVPIISVDKHPIGAGKVGQLTQAIKKDYLDTVRGKERTHLDWRTPIY
jgi:branched-chain amino acid aminotransferase